MADSTINENRSELKLTLRPLNILIDNLGLLVMYLEGQTTRTSKLLPHCLEMQQQLIEYRAKVFRELEVEA